MAPNPAWMWELWFNNLNASKPKWHQTLYECKNYDLKIKR